MRNLAHNRKALAAVAVVIALVAVVVPSCRMVGCSMAMGSHVMGFQGAALGFFSDCGGQYVASTTPSAVVPSGSDALTLALIAALFVAVALVRPTVAVQRIIVHPADPPPPPEEPRGERFRV